MNSRVTGEGDEDEDVKKKCLKVRQKLGTRKNYKSLKMLKFEKFEIFKNLNGLS